MKHDARTKCTLHGSSVLELRHRITRLGEALERQHGKVLRVSYGPRTSLLDPCLAVVHYALPRQNGKSRPAREKLREPSKG